MQRAHRAIIDPYGLSASPKDWPFPHKQLIIVAHADEYDSAVIKPLRWKVELEACNLDTIKSTFRSYKCE